MDFRRLAVGVQGVGSGGQNYTPKEVSLLQMKLSGCLVFTCRKKIPKLCRDWQGSSRGGKRGMNGVSKRGKV